MNRSISILAGLSTAAAMLFLSMAAASAQQAPQYPLDDKLANEPAPWTVPGKWGKHGNWGRWGEDDKRGMLNYITPEMVVQAAALVKNGKVYALGEELTSDVPRVITPARVGIQVIQENDGYDRVAAKSGEFDAKRFQGAASFTFMHNHTGSHLDTLGHIYHDNALFNNMPPPKALGTAHGDAASVIEMVGRGCCSTSPGTRAPTLSRSITGSPSRICRTRRRRRTSKFARATSCSFGRDGGRHGMNRMKPGV